jgi:hypothetical protein
MAMSSVSGDVRLPACHDKCHQHSERLQMYRVLASMFRDLDLAAAHQPPGGGEQPRPQPAIARG